MTWPNMTSIGNTEITIDDAIVDGLLISGYDEPNFSTLYIFDELQGVENELFNQRWWFNQFTKSDLLGALACNIDTYNVVLRWYNNFQ